MKKFIELYGGPGIGKSTYAAGLYYHFKLLGCNTELVREYAKDLAWAGKLDGTITQQQIFKEQSKRELILINSVDSPDVIITDSPIRMSQVYGSDKKWINRHENKIKKAEYEYIKVLLVRDTSLQYEEKGRAHDLTQALELDKSISELTEYDYLVDSIIVDLNFVRNIFMDI